MPDPSPGSPNALVLPTTSDTGEDTDTAGARLTGQLEAFLDSTKYTAVAVVHGLAPSAPNAFDLAKESRPSKGGVIWVTDEKFLSHLSGPAAKRLQRLLVGKPSYVLSFFSVAGDRITGHLHWLQLRSAELDRKYNDAAKNKVDEE